MLLTFQVLASHILIDPLAGDAAFDNGETNLFILASGNGPVDAFDWYGTWKLQDALMDCALHNQNCEYAFGDTPEQHGMGSWSDGTPVRILEITPSASTGVNDLKNEISVSVFPNPANENLQFIVSGLQLNAKAQLQLYDELGRKVSDQSIESPSWKLETGNFKTGVYFYQLKNSLNHILKSGKLVIE